ncbi:MAG: hypothetical protein ACR2HE_07050 [Casimicrobiaceae bacterium]
MSTSTPANRLTFDEHGVGYRVCGAGGVIPPHAMAAFEVELLGIG